MIEMANIQSDIAILDIDAPMKKWRSTAFSTK